MTDDELTSATAVFDSRAGAQMAADAAMPRRKHHRPYAQSSGYHSVQAGANRWIVMAYPNVVLLRDGSMYDYGRRVTVRP